MRLKLHLQKVLPHRYPCHTWDLGLGTLCAVVRPNFHVSTTEIDWIDLK
jgi:hypothetical protein